MFQGTMMAEGDQAPEILIGVKIFNFGNAQD
jgi:hypothetical protein